MAMNMVLRTGFIDPLLDSTGIRVYFDPKPRIAEMPRHSMTQAVECAHTIATIYA